MSTSDTALFDRIQDAMARQGLLQNWGARLLHVSAGEVQLGLDYSERVTQQRGSFHGGAIGALADVAAGFAALTVAPEGSDVVSAEYKINFLGSYQGGALRAIGRVVKPGRRLIITSAEVTHVDDAGQEGPCALMQQTLVPVPKGY